MIQEDDCGYDPNDPFWVEHKKQAEAEIASASEEKEPTQDQIRIQFILNRCELWCDGNIVESLDDLDGYIYRAEVP